MNTEEMLGYVLTHGNIYQKYLVRRDALGEDIGSESMMSLQQEIVSSKSILKLLKSQNEDGWFGIELHGCPGKAMDATATMLRDYGVEPYHDFMKRAQRAVLDDKIPYRPNHNCEGFDRGYSYPRAVALAAFQEENAELPELLYNAYARIMDIFEDTLQYEGADDYSRECTDKKHIGMRVMLKDKYIAWISDINVLAQCGKWRNPRTEQLADEAFQNIGRLMPITTTLEPYKGRYLGTIGNYMSLQCANPFENPRGEIAWWTAIISNLCKLVNVNEIPYFKRQIDCVRELAQQDKLKESFSEQGLTAFNDFFCFGIKNKTDEQRTADMYFKFGMILYNADKVR